MNLLIFGASGMTGVELVRQSLAQGHLVTAFVRVPARLKLENANLRIIQGDVRDYPTVDSAVKGHDAVISALGVSKKLSQDPIVVDGIRKIIKAMETNQVSRFVYLSFIGVTESRNDAGFLIRHLVSRIVHNEIADHELKEQLIRASRLDWTIVRPPKLTNGAQTHNYRSGEGIRTGVLFPTMSRANVADFMLRVLRDNAFVRKSPTILY